MENRRKEFKLNLGNYTGSVNSSVVFQNKLITASCKALPDASGILKVFSDLHINELDRGKFTDEIIVPDYCGSYITALAVFTYSQEKHFLFTGYENGEICAWKINFENKIFKDENEIQKK